MRSGRDMLEQRADAGPDDLRQWESSSKPPGAPVQLAALAEPDLERYTIRLPARVIHNGLG